MSTPDDSKPVIIDVNYQSIRNQLEQGDANDTKISQLDDGFPIDAEGKQLSRPQSPTVKELPNELIEEHNNFRVVVSPKTDYVKTASKGSFFFLLFVQRTMRKTRKNFESLQP